MALLSVIILTYNEIKHIRRAIQGIAALGADVFVVDSFSTDQTCEIARSEGASVVQHAFLNQAQQFQWALATLPIATPWVMRLDADEVLTPELVDEIKARLPSLPAAICGVNLKRRHIFLGRWIRHGGRYPVTLLRIWRRGTAEVEQRWMDEHMILTTGEAITFRHDFADHNLQDITYFIDKHNKYATREAVEVLSQRYRMKQGNPDPAGRRSSFQARAKHVVKQGLYNRLPFWCGPLAYFLARYVLQFGFLDGKAGLIYHVLQGFWYRFLVGAKIVEFEYGMSGATSHDEHLAALESLSGLPLRSHASGAE